MARRQPKTRLKIRLRKGDLVEVISGKDSGKRGKGAGGACASGVA
jgi:hypothetical protein